METLITVIQLIFTILYWTVIIAILVHWVIRDPYHPVRSFLDSIVEPMLAPIRRIMPQTGMLDFSPMVLLIALRLIQVVLIALLRSFSV